MMHRSSPLLFVGRQRKQHPWMRFDDNSTNNNTHNESDNSQHPQQHTASRRAPQPRHSSLDTTVHRPIPEHPEEPGTLPKRRPSLLSTNNTGGSSTRSMISNTSRTTFQQYRQQRSVRKHPWRTDGKGTTRWGGTRARGVNRGDRS